MKALPPASHVKFLSGSLDQRIPGDVKDQYIDSATRPLGYAGRQLGYELDLKYSKNVPGENSNLASRLVLYYLEKPGKPKRMTLRPIICCCNRPLPLNSRLSRHHTVGPVSFDPVIRRYLLR